VPRWRRETHSAKTQQQERNQQVKVNEFSTTSPAVKFAAIGDRVAGAIVEDPELEPDKFGNAGDRVLVLAIIDEDGVTRRLYARKQMLGAIGQAVTDAGVDEIECGGQLSITYVEDKPTGGASPMKVYAAEYRPPSPLGNAWLGADNDVAF
jgi:hypothetical protein